jgi:hypothetical protein
METERTAGLTAEQIDAAARRGRAADPNYYPNNEPSGQTGRSVPQDRLGQSERQFLEVNGVVVNADHIVEVDFTSATGVAVMHMSSGNCRSYSGEDAAALRRFFAPQNTGQAPAPPPDHRPGSAFDAEALGHQESTTGRRGGRIPLPLQSGSALYVRPGAPDIVVSNDEERNLAIERGYRPALAEALPAGVETVLYADGTSATGAPPLPRVSVNGAPAVGDEEAPAPDGGQAGKPVPLTEHQVWEK